MKAKQLRLEGIYDQKTFDLLSQLSIKNFSFDMRPLGLNFFPQHLFLKLLSQSWRSGDRYFLHYAYEKDFVIEKMAEDLKQLFSPFNPFSGQLFLEFSDQKPLSFYEQFKLPFYWHYHWEGEFHQILHSPLLQGVVLSCSFLQGLYQREDREHFFQSLSEMRRKRDNRPLEFILAGDWDCTVAEGFLRQFSFDMLSLPINAQLELCYRQVDVEKMQQSVKLFKENFTGNET